MSEVEYWDGTGVEPAVLEAHVRQLAAEQPDHVYDRDAYPDRHTGGAACKYTHTLEDNSKVPGCIVGQAIFNITGKLVNQENNQGSVLDFQFMGAEYRRGGGGWSDRAKFLANVQSHQDNGVPWGTAVARADQREHDNGNYYA